MTIVRPRKKRLILGLLCLALALASPIVANQWFWSQAANETAARGLKKLAENSIKHAYAASVTYNGLRTLGLSADSATRITLTLGTWLEYVECYLRPGNKRDSTNEVIKDFHNNIAGIAAANWLESNRSALPDTSLLHVVGELAEGAVLSITERKSAGNGNMPDLSLATQWMDNNKSPLTRTVDTYLKMMMLPQP